jgi:hypothetical protein
MRFRQPAFAAPQKWRPLCSLRIKVAGRNVSVDIATKSVREAIATIAETGADQCVALVQGKLERKTAGGMNEDMPSEAGLVVQLKTPKTTSETP